VQEGDRKEGNVHGCRSEPEVHGHKDEGAAVLAGGDDGGRGDEGMRVRQWWTVKCERESAEGGEAGDEGEDGEE
jgi:hypothetical protein